MRLKIAVSAVQFCPSAPTLYARRLPHPGAFFFARRGRGPCDCAPLGVQSEQDGWAPRWRTSESRSRVLRREWRTAMAETIVAGALEFHAEDRSTGRDGGPSLQVYSTDAGSPVQILRFDMFRNQPHY